MKRKRTEIESDDDMELDSGDESQSRAFNIYALFSAISEIADHPVLCEEPFFNFEGLLSEIDCYLHMLANLGKTTSPKHLFVQIKNLLQALNHLPEKIFEELYDQFSASPQLKKVRKSLICYPYQGLSESRLSYLFYLGKDKLGWPWEGLVLLKSFLLKISNIENGAQMGALHHRY